MKNKTFLDSIKCAIRGLVKAVKTEKNFKYYIGIDFIFLILNILLKSNKYDYCLFVGSTILVFALEYVNTAIERLSDTVETQYHPGIEDTKDIAAAAVLVAGIGFFLIQGIVLIGKLL